MIIVSIRLLKRRYISNGFATSIHYFTPDELTNGFFSVSLGYASDNETYSDMVYISIIIRDNMNIEHIWRDMVMFINSFPIWNKQYTRKEE